MVNVVGKFTLPKLKIQPKKAGGGGGGISITKRRTATPGSTAGTLDNGDASEASTSRSSSAQVTLGIKVKRLHGDAFTYASICRTVLDQAGVKDGAWE